MKRGIRKKSPIRNTLGSLLAAGLLASACGSSGGESISAAGSGADDSSAVTVEGSDSGIVGEGDDRPEDETDSAAVVLVTVDLPTDAGLAGMVIVALEDISLADAPAIEISRTELTVAQLFEQGSQIEVFLPLPLDGSIDVTATAHVDVDENGVFSQGDWISPELALVGPGAESVTVSMVQI